MPNYGDPKYWEERYDKQGKETTFDWLENYNSIKPLIEELSISKKGKILNLGCGNAEICEDMYDDGYKNIYNIDIAGNVIEFMKERNSVIRKEMICKNLYFYFSYVFS